MAAFPTQFASVASLSAPASLLNSGPKHSPGTPGSPSGLDLAARSAAMPHNPLGAPGAQGPYSSSAAAAAAAQYSPAAAGLLAYSRLAPGFTDTMYGASFPNPSAGGFYGLGADPSALYVNPLTGTPYDLKENAEIWRNLSQQATCFAYDPTGLYSYGYGGMDLSLAARRKNATKENTGTLKAWLQEHKKNPYPTKGEKIMLAIITKMTLTQVSTWFANARRRLKKDNKMTWSPRNKTDSDEDDDDVAHDNKAGSSTSTQLNGERHDLRDDSDDREDADAGQVDVTGCDSDDDDAIVSFRTSQADPLRPGLPATTVPVLPTRPDESRSRSPSPNPRNNSSSSENTPTRPRIWSLADVLGPSTTSSESRANSDTRTTSVHGGLSGVPGTHGLSYPMPLKPTASSALQGYVSPATHASLRHWSDRSPYPIPVTLHGGLPSPFGLHNHHTTRPNGLQHDNRVSINGTCPTSLPGSGYTSHPGLPSAFPMGPTGDRLRTHNTSSSPEEPGEIRKMHGSSMAGPIHSSPSSSPSTSPGAIESPLSLTAFKPVPRSKPQTYVHS